MSITVKDDPTSFDAVRSRLRAFSGRAGLAGIFDPELATLGGRHELGAGSPVEGELGPGENDDRPGVPGRPWMSPATDAAAQRVGSKFEDDAGGVVDGDMTADAVLLAAADSLAKASVRYVKAGQVGGPDLSDSAKRNDPRKLIDTGDMIDAVEPRVVNDGELEG